MKIDLTKDGNLMITPETYFEYGFLENYTIGTIHRKYGLSPSDFLGIKITNKKDEKSYNDCCASTGCNIEDWYRLKFKDTNLNSTSISELTEYEKSKI